MGNLLGRYRRDTVPPALYPYITILDSVKQRLFGMLEGNETMDGSQESPSMAEVISAMGSLQKIGSGYGQEFSIPETEREAAAYVARYGSEIVRS